jgi:alpha-L-arabinofuranosidase
VRAANFFQLVHPLFSGSMSPQGVAKPSLLAIEMFARYFGSTLLKTQVTSPTKAVEAAGLADSEQAAPLVEAVSSISADRKRVYIMLINKSLYSPQQTEVRVRNLPRLSSGTVRVLTGPAPDANNGNDLLEAPGLVWAPQAIAPVGSWFHAGKPGTVQIGEFRTSLANSMRFSLPPLSIVNLEFSPIP